MIQNFPYPKVKGSVPPNLTAVSAQYKKMVWQVFLSMLLFFVTYALLLAAAAAIIYYSFFLAIILISVKVHWVTIMAALGIILMSGMLGYFLIRFIFKKRSVADDPTHIEITREQEPVLFAFIDAVCDECKAARPAQVVLSPGVDAAVMQNTSIWNLILPARKKLLIGGALVDSLTLTEFKAVIGHEFGHFSQSSTKLGVAVYNLNRIIISTINDDGEIQNTINKLSGIHTIVNFFLMISVNIMRGMVWVLVKMFEVINVSSKALSRQMEFHADSVAVSVSGSKAIGTSLYRLSFAASAFQMASIIARINAQNTGSVGKIFIPLLGTKCMAMRRTKV